MRKLSAAQTRRAISRFGIERPLLEAFGYADTSIQHRYAFHRHTRHQLIAPQAGLMMVETPEALHVVSPGQAAWIPAGVRHATTIGNAPAYSLFFPTSSYRSPEKSLRIIASTPLLRELLAAAALPLPAPAAIRRCLFVLLHHLCLQALKNPAAPDLRRPRSPNLVRAVDHLLGHLDISTPALLARQSGVSERTLRRHFRAELGLTPERYIQQARLTRAMQLLLEGRASRTIVEIALEVGYTNHSAFSTAFRRFTGQSPATFRSSSSAPRRFSLN